MDENTSTIFPPVLFKIVNAIVENKIEQVYEKARKLTENIADDE